MCGRARKINCCVGRGSCRAAAPQLIVQEWRLLENSSGCGAPLSYRVRTDLSDGSLRATRLISCKVNIFLRGSVEDQQPSRATTHLTHEIARHRASDDACINTVVSHSSQAKSPYYCHRAPFPCLQHQLRTIAASRKRNNELCTSKDPKRSRGFRKKRASPDIPC